MRTLLRLAIAGLFVVTLAAESPVPAPPVRQARTRLVVLVVIDQMRADYLTHYDAWLTGGFRRLETSGAVYSQAFYPYASTETAQGHTTMVTGESPSVSGIVGDTWYDPRRTSHPRP